MEKPELRIQWILRFLPALLMMIIIFVHSAMPAEMSSRESSFLEEIIGRLLRLDPETATFVVRKGAHFLEYLVLGGCLLFFANGWKLPDCAGMKQRFFSRGLPSWACGVIYAQSDELHQLFVPGRSCELRDLCIDAAGVLAGILLCLLADSCVRRRRRRGREEGAADS